MGYRIFRDSNGAEWQTWDVVPRHSERRTGDRRARAMQSLDRERRMRSERRVVAGHRNVLTAKLSDGWLCFEAEHEKRRLTPIPADWNSCPRQQLESYCASARPVKRVSGEITAVPLDFAATDTG